MNTGVASDFQAVLDLQPVLLVRARHFCKSRQLAEDIVQDTLLSAYKSFNLFTPGTNLKAWVNKILYNQFVDLYRTRRKVPASSLQDTYKGSDGEFVPNTLIQEERPLAVSVFDPNFFDDVPKCLIDGLEELGSDFRNVMLLNMEGFSHKEISERLGIPVGTVMSRLFRARSIMKGFALQLKD